MVPDSIRSDSIKASKSDLNTNYVIVTLKSLMLGDVSKLTNTDRSNYSSQYLDLEKRLYLSLIINRSDIKYM